MVRKFVYGRIKNKMFTLRDKKGRINIIVNGESCIVGYKMIDINARQNLLHMYNAQKMMNHSVLAGLARL